MRKAVYTKSKKVKHSGNQTSDLVLSQSTNYLLSTRYTKYLLSDISVRSVQHQSRYEILRQIRYIIQYLYWTLRYRYGDLGADTGVATTYIPVPGSQVHSVSHRPDFGYFGTFGPASTRYRHIVTSSVQSLASTRPRTRTHQTARPNHIMAYCYRCYARYTEMLTTHKQQA